MPCQFQATLPRHAAAQDARSTCRHETARRNLESSGITALLSFYGPTTNISKVVTIVVVTLVELVVVWSGAGGPFVSPAMTAVDKTQTNAKAFSVFNIGTSEYRLANLLTRELLVPAS